MILKGSRMYYPKMYHFGILTILSCRQFEKQHMQESLSLGSLYLPKNRPSKRNSLIIDFPGISSTRVDGLLHRKGD